MTTKKQIQEEAQELREEVRRLERRLENQTTVSNNQRFTEMAHIKKAFNETVASGQATVRELQAELLAAGAAGDYDAQLKLNVELQARLDAAMTTILGLGSHTKFKH
tara:strand:+ start:3474 stop:3794 length:321 start_codon:yes stop_codon:yes gene_type:complete